MILNKSTNSAIGTKAPDNPDKKGKFLPLMVGVSKAYVLFALFALLFEASKEP